MADWVEVSVSASGQSAEAVSHRLFQEGAQGIVQSDPGLQIAYFPADSDQASLIRRLRDFLSNLSSFGLDPGEGAAVSWRRVPDTDWERSWKEHFGVTKVGRSVVVRPTWRPYDPRPGEVVIDLDPGMAFGTGDHPTTAMCIRALERCVTPGCDVIDIGTGSGILAIAAARLGASRVLACDIDATAVEVARANAVMNGVEGVVDVHRGSWRDLIDQGGSADLVVANLTAHAVSEMGWDVSRLLSPGGVFVASGISQRERGRVEASLHEAGWTLREIDTQGNWVAVLVGTNALENRTL